MTPRRILLKAGEGSPLCLATDRRVEILPDMPDLALTHDLSVDLWDWSRRRPVDREGSTGALRAHHRDGLALATRLAAELGPQWVLNYHDVVHDSSTLVCWQCGGFHWRSEPHEEFDRPRSVQLVGEYGHWPLRFDARDDFAPDDPVIALGLSETLVDELYVWSRAVHDLVETTINPAAQPAAPAPMREELAAQGARLTRSLSQELGPGWTVEFGGLVS